MEARGEGDIINMDWLTMFADYRVPQALVYLGVLRYSDALMQALKNGEKWRHECLFDLINVFAFFKKMFIPLKHLHGFCCTNGRLLCCCTTLPSSLLSFLKTRSFYGIKIFLFGQHKVSNSWIELEAKYKSEKCGLLLYSVPLTQYYGVWFIYGTYCFIYFANCFHQFCISGNICHLDFKWERLQTSVWKFFAAYYEQDLGLGLY